MFVSDPLKSMGEILKYTEATARDSRPIYWYYTLVTLYFSTSKLKKKKQKTAMCLSGGGYGGELDMQTRRCL